MRLCLKTKNPKTNKNALYTSLILMKRNVSTAKIGKPSVCRAGCGVKWKHMKGLTEAQILSTEGFYRIWGYSPGCLPQLSEYTWPFTLVP